ncbi:MAG: SDR family oxidoreductase [Clostridium sp.]
MGKTVLITGGAKGIGESCARLFGESGYNVLINYKSSDEKAASLHSELTSSGINARVFKCDVGVSSEVKAMVEYCIEEFGSLDVLINNAGISQEKLFIDLTDEDIDSMIDSNLKGVLYCSRECVKYMIYEKSGNIINISSIWGMVGASCEVHYSTMKAGIIGFTKALAKEVGPSGIRVNAVAPGVIQTDMLNSFSEEDIECLRDETPLMRIGTVEDVAKCCLFLASNDSSFITGQVISPNGGFVI